jgi:hypothetical protein
MPVEPEGGDPACWLDHVCPDCGRCVERDGDHEPNCELRRRTSTVTSQRWPVSPPAS